MVLFRIQIVQSSLANCQWTCTTKGEPLKSLTRPHLSVFTAVLLVSVLQWNRSRNGGSNLVTMDSLPGCCCCCGWCCCSNSGLCCCSDSGLSLAGTIRLGFQCKHLAHSLPFGLRESWLIWITKFIPSPSQMFYWTILKYLTHDCLKKKKKHKQYNNTNKNAECVRFWELVSKCEGYPLKALAYLWQSLERWDILTGIINVRRVSVSNLSGNPSVNIAPVSSLPAFHCGAKSCLQDGSFLTARVNTLAFSPIPRLHYAASQRTAATVRSYQFHYSANPLTEALTCWNESDIDPARVVRFWEQWMSGGDSNLSKYWNRPMTNNLCLVSSCRCQLGTLVAAWIGMFAVCIISNALPQWCCKVVFEEVFSSPLESC